MSVAKPDNGDKKESIRRKVELTTKDNYDSDLDYESGDEEDCGSFCERIANAFTDADAGHDLRGGKIKSRRKKNKKRKTRRKRKSRKSKQRKRKTRRKLRKRKKKTKRRKRH